MAMTFTIQRLVDTPAGLLQVTAERGRIPLPGSPDNPLSELSYGPYLNAISSFLSNNSCHALTTVLSKHLGRASSLDEIKRVEIISTKHGTLYHVARLKVYTGERVCSFAVNVSTYPEQHAFLENEFHLLKHLYDNFHSVFLPIPYLKGETTYSDDQTGYLPLRLFIAQWFEDYHEFHLSPHLNEDLPAIKVWETSSNKNLLDGHQTYSLYRSASAILTTYLDGRTFQQIYPWHHAAGDFVVQVRESEVDLRLITVRDYRCLLSPGPGFENVWAAILHFFLNITIRLRLDRFDGTGKLAWAGPDCLRGIIDGFFPAWSEKLQKYPHLPSSNGVFEVLRSFNQKDWLSLAELVNEGGQVEHDEIEFLKPRMNDHVTALHNALQQKS